VDACASAIKIARTDVASKRSGDTTFEREVSNVVMGVNVNKSTQRKNGEQGKTDIQGMLKTGK